MAQREEDMDRRRQKREAQRQKQRAAAKRMRRNLFVAVVAIALCAWGIWNLTADSREADAASAQAEETEPATTAAETKATEPSPITTIHLRAAGDLNVTDSVVSAGIAVNGYDFSPVFKDVSSTLSGADLTFLNLEGNICGEPYGSDTTSAPQQLLTDLRGCGVDLIQMANSCSINNGVNGLITTLANIRSAGIEPLGAYSSDREFELSKGYTIVEVQGIKIAFVAFTKGLGGRGMPAGSENLVNRLYVDYSTEYSTLDTDFIEKVLKNAKGEDPDLIVALLHWGSEYNDEISSTQSSLVSLLQKRGVSVIVGTHSHTVQPIVYDETGGTLVAYSLGDFFGDAERGGTNYSIILDIEVTKDSTTDTTRVTGYSYTPIYTVTEDECPDGKRRVVRIESAMDGYGIVAADDEEDVGYTGQYLDSVTSTCYSTMQKALERIETRVDMTSFTQTYSSSSS